MSRVVGIGTALPQFKYSSDDILSGARGWLKGNPEYLELFERFVSSSKIGTRYFSSPLERILAGSTAEERTSAFWKNGTELGIEAVRKCLDLSGVRPNDIGSVVFTSCSVPVIPSIDVEIIQKLGLPLSVKRVPIYQHGCAGGAAALGVSNVLAENSGYSLIIAVELCSLVYQGGDLTPGNLVGSALFGDGAAAVLVGPGKGMFSIMQTASELLPGTQEMMGYDLKDDGNHLRLKKELPGELAKMAPELIRKFLKRNGVSPESVANWLIHPGGVKILNLLEEEFDLGASQSQWAWRVLEKFGNMSSASILFVLDEFLTSKTSRLGDRVLSIGIGPGLTLEQTLFEVSE